MKNITRLFLVLVFAELTHAGPISGGSCGNSGDVTTLDAWVALSSPCTTVYGSTYGGFSYSSSTPAGDISVLLVDNPYSANLVLTGWTASNGDGFNVSLGLSADMSGTTTDSSSLLHVSVANQWGLNAAPAQVATSVANEFGANVRTIYPENSTENGNSAEYLAGCACITTSQFDLVGTTGAGGELNMEIAVDYIDPNPPAQTPEPTFIPLVAFALLLLVSVRARARGLNIAH